MKDRKTRKEEEKRIIAEMDEAMRAVRGEAQASEQNTIDTIDTTQNTTERTDDRTAQKPSQKPSQKLYCRRCKSELGANGVCRVCGYRVYMPMDENKRKKIRLIVAGVCIVGFLILYLIVK